MKIFLTSSADRVLERLLPYLSNDPKEMKVAFIPTAGDIYAERPWQERDRNELVRLGFQVEDIDLKFTKDKELKSILSQKDVIFVAGGNTSYLLEKAQESGFIDIVKNLKDSDSIYIGSSAGSMLAGPNIEMDKIYDDGEFGKELDSYDALELVDFVVLPHANREEYRPYLDKIKNQYGSKYFFTELGDDQCLVIVDGEQKLIDISL